MTNEDVVLGRVTLTLRRSGNNIVDVNIQTNDGLRSLKLYQQELIEITRWLNTWFAKEKSERFEPPEQPKRYA